MAGALQQTFGGLGYLNAAPSAINTHNIAAANSSLEFIFQAQKDMVITRLGYVCTGILAPPIYRISLQSVTRTTTTRASGTILGGGTPASKLFTPTANWEWQTLDNPIAVTRGEWYAVVIDYSSGTIDASHRGTFGTYNLGLGTLKPIIVTVTAGSPTIQSNVGAALFGYGTASEAFGGPCSAATSAIYFTTSTPDEYAMKFTVPSNVCNSYRILGINLLTAPQALSNTAVKVVLYGGASVSPVDSTGAVTERTVIQDMTFYLTDLVIGSSRPHKLLFDESVLETLVAGATYRIGIQPQGGSGNGVQYNQMSVAALDDWNAWPGGANLSQSVRQDSGNWTDSPLTRLCAEIIFDDVTGPALPIGYGGTARRHTYGAPGGLSQNTGASVAGFPMNQAADQVEVIFQAQEDTLVTRLGYGCTGILAPPVYTICLQGVTRSGSTTIPDGTILGGGTPASATFTPVTGWTWVTLTNPIALLRGQWYSYVIKYASGTIGGSNFATFGVYNPSFATMSNVNITNDNGVRSVNSSGALATFGYGSTSKVYGGPVSSTAQTLFNSGSNPDEFAVKFTVPRNFCTTYKVLGIRWLTAPETLNTNQCKIVLYGGVTPGVGDSAGAVTEKTVYQDAAFYNTDLVSGSFRLHEVWFDESTLTTLVTGATYRLGIQPQSGSGSGVYITRFSVAAAADLDAYPGGPNLTMSSRVDGGNWTDDPLSKVMAELIIDEVAVPAAGQTGLAGSALKIPYGGLGVLNPTAGPSWAPVTLDNALDQAQYLFQAEEAAIITDVGFRVQNLTGTQPTWKVSLQGITTGGVADGTSIAGAAKVFVPVANTFNWVTLTTPASVTKGQKLAIVVQYNGGTIGASNNMILLAGNQGFASNNPYWAFSDNGAAAAMMGTPFLPTFAYTTSGKARRYGAPIFNHGSLLFHQGSSPNEYAMKFSIPPNFCSTYRVLGFRLMTAPGALSNDWTLMQLYSGVDPRPENSIGAVTETNNIAALAFSHNELTSASQRIHEFWFSQAPLLYAGAWYRLGFAPQIAANGLYLNYISQQEIEDWQGWPFGNNVGLSSRTGSGNWTDSPLLRIMGEVILSEITGRAAGGLMVHPGMAGRIHA